MSNFLEDPRLRQRWNQISHTTEAVTENAAAGIWTFQQDYINPCLAAVGDAVEPCIAPCFGNRDERARWARAREHHQYATRAEYTFDFYDDWDDDDELLANSGGATSRGEDWDRLIGGSGAASRRANAGEAGDQPRRKRGMSYGTRGGRRKGDEEDPTIIPSTTPLGFLGRLPWKIGGTLRYKPSAAFLQDHPGAASHQGDEGQPLLGPDGDRGEEEEETGEEVVTRPQGIMTQSRKRSGTGGSGDTSDSYRSRGDLFPSDGEEYEDAMEIDDEFAVGLERVDDRSSTKGKRPAGSRRVSRTVSGTTLSSRGSRSPHTEGSVHSLVAASSSVEDLQRQEEEEAERQEDQEVARKREAATQLARARGLSASENYSSGESELRAKSAMFSIEEMARPRRPQEAPPAEAVLAPEAQDEEEEEGRGSTPEEEEEEEEEERQESGNDSPGSPADDDEFIPARLPNFR